MLSKLHLLVHCDCIPLPPVDQCGFNKRDAGPMPVLLMLQPGEPGYAANIVSTDGAAIHSNISIYLQNTLHITSFFSSCHIWHPLRPWPTHPIDKGALSVGLYLTNYITEGDNSDMGFYTSIF